MSSLLDLRRMRHFVAVAEELHFRRAAERLRMSQPPLSQSIQALERELEVTLFERSRQRVFLTPAGRLLLERARSILTEVEATRLALRDAAGGLGGELRIGFTASSGLMPFVHSAVQRFREQSPGVRLTMQEMPSRGQVEALHKRTLDVAILRKPRGRQDADIVYEKMCEDTLVVAVHEGNPIARMRAVRMKRLREEAFVTYPRDSGISLFQEIDGLARAASFIPTVVQEAGDSSTIIGLIASGLGVAVVPSSLRCIKLKGVCFVDLSDAGARSALHVACRRGAAAGLTTRMRDLLLTTAATALRPGP